MAEIIVTGQNFKEEVLDSDIPVLVDFWASWCGPCRMLAPTIAQVAEEKQGIVKVGKINVDDSPELAAQYGIASIPTLMVFVNGEPVKTSIGVIPKSAVEALLP